MEFQRVGIDLSGKPPILYSKASPLDRSHLQQLPTPAIIAPKVGGVMDSAGKKITAEMALSGSPSIMFDAVAVLAGPAGDKSLSAEPDAISFLMDADRHLKAIAIAGVSNLVKKTHVEGVVGVTDLRASGDISKFIDFARNGKVWERDSA
jgi:catalase